jgi:hypothetical protein
MTWIPAWEATFSNQAGGGCELLAEYGSDAFCACATKAKYGMKTLASHAFAHRLSSRDIAC